MWFYDAPPKKKIHHKPPAILYGDKLEDFPNKCLYFKNVLLAYERNIKRENVKRKDTRK